MKCKICGANLTGDGDICENCYKQYNEEQELKEDLNEQFVIKRKYSISFNLYRYFWIFIIIILSVIICLTGKEILPAIELILGGAIILGLLLFWDKRISKATKAVFYEKRVVYTFKFLFFDTVKEVKYENIKNITIFQQSMLQKRFGYGDICIYAKGSFPGVSLLNGFQVKNVENANETLNIISQLVGLERKK